jgi:hypothetical protein
MLLLCHFVSSSFLQPALGVFSTGHEVPQSKVKHELGVTPSFLVVTALVVYCTSGIC